MSQTISKSTWYHILSKCLDSREWHNNQLQVASSPAPHSHIAPATTTPHHGCLASLELITLFSIYEPERLKNMWVIMGECNGVSGCLQAERNVSAAQWREIPDLRESLGLALHACSSSPPGPGERPNVAHGWALSCGIALQMRPMRLIMKLVARCSP